MAQILLPPYNEVRPRRKELSFKSVRAPSKEIPFKSAKACFNQTSNLLIANLQDVDNQRRGDIVHDEMIENITRRFGKVDLSVSSYDTAWVAMVPCDHHQQKPCFPGCLKWIMENQRIDGSWGLSPNNHSSLLVKDSLTSTLPCVLALHKWEVGEQLVHKGLEFMGSNKFAVSDKDQSSPLGFDIIFPGMLKHATELGLNLPLDSGFIDSLLHNNEIQIQSLKGKKSSSLAYFGEGLGKSYEWEEMIKKEQRSNGSLFNSPATTAAAFIHSQDDKCFHYLANAHQNAAVPTVYPFDIYTRLCLVDTIDRLGISHHFESEITTVLDQTYRCWQQEDEEIFLDIACCVMAFRLLRMNGYQVSSDVLGHLVERDHFFNTTSPQFTNTDTIIQLYRASQIPIFQSEPVLEQIYAWTSTFLKNQLLCQDTCDDGRLYKEVEYALDYPIDNLDRLAHRRGIELYNVDNVRMLKTCYRCSNIDNIDILTFAQKDFNMCQSIHLEELQQLEKWVKESSISSLDFKWHILVSSYFQLAAVHYTPELSDARIAWTQNSFVGTIIDDMFDVDGSIEELLNLIDLLEKWDGYSNTVASVGYCTERVKIVFLAVVEIINHQATRGLTIQKRCIKQELIQIWRNFFKCCFQEVEWSTNKTTPSWDEFLTNGFKTIGIELYSICFYLLGPELSPHLFKSDEYAALFKHAGIIGRLYNDYCSAYEIGRVERDVNGCKLLVSYEDSGVSSVEEAREKVRRMIESSKREELRMMLEKNSTSIIPKEFMESYFKLYKICYYLFDKGDEYRHPGKTMGDINDLIYRPRS